LVCKERIAENNTMAQWNGQFTGNTHATKVKDLEELLVHTVNVFRDLSSDEERFKKEKAIHKIAEKLLIARLKFLKAKLYETEPVIEEKAKKKNVQIEHLQQRIEEMQTQGANGILIEFDLKDLVK
jgi:ABC-type methionine transport system ATPase subunit